MLKNRIIATVVVRDNIVVQSFGFKRYLPIGKLGVSLEFLDAWGIDEIIVLDISATKCQSNEVLESLSSQVKACFVPLTYGGGLVAKDDVSLAFESGADKVSFNNAFFTNPEIIRETSMRYGAQSCVLSIDLIKEAGDYKVFRYVDSTVSDLNLEDAVKKGQDMGVGEILINSIDRDGSYEGFDREMADRLSFLEIPVILAGGARYSSDFDEIFSNTSIKALAAGNMFHFVEHSVSKLKSTIVSDQIRKAINVDYGTHRFVEDQRNVKLDEDVLEELMYQRLADREI
jgi:cyclase